MFYIYEKSSTYIMGKMDKEGLVRPDHKQYYKTMASAKAAQTKMSKKWFDMFRRGIPDYAQQEPEENDPQFRFGIAEVEYFHKNIEATRKAKNLMSKEWFVEPINTPGYMSPRSETYWSM
mgnify:FL=1|jgi:hypothetical protein